MIRGLWRFVLLASVMVVTVSGVRTIYISNSQDIALKLLPLDPANPGQRRVGELIFLNAWELGSRNEDFGGFSALASLPGGRFIGVSDAGTLIGFGLTSDDRTDRPFIAPLPDSQGANISYLDRDSEGMTYDVNSGQFWVSYEAKHAIRRFSRSFSRRTGYVALTGESRWPRNKGVEAITRLADGRFVAITENLEKGLHEGFLFSGDPVEKGTVKSVFGYRPPPGFRVTDMATLPDGRILVLNRKIAFPAGFSAKIAILAPQAIRPKSVAEGTVIATLSAPLLIDNMEGVAVSTDKAGTTIWLISDDNFSAFQRTLLMKFRLSERTSKKKPEAVAAPGFESL